jgi:hypothetical protein
MQLRGPRRCNAQGAGVANVSSRFDLFRKKCIAAPQTFGIATQCRRYGGKIRRAQRIPSRRPAPRCSAGIEALQALQASPARDLAAWAFSVIGATVLIKSFQILENIGAMDSKLSRKAVHTLAGPLFVLSWPLFSDAPYARLAAAAVPALNFLRLLLLGTGILKDERAVAAISRTGDPKELLGGPLYYVAVLLAATLLFWKGSPVGELKK